MKNKTKASVTILFLLIGILPLSAQPVKDADGNEYKSMKIGNQIWMTENLKTTKFSDGKSIPNEKSDTAWCTIKTGAYCWYNNDEVSHKNKYGALYNWYAVNTGKICPLGWHVPSDGEWTVLTTFLEGDNIAGGKLKSVSGWLNNGNGINTSGFTGLPGGGRGGYSLLENSENNKPNPREGGVFTGIQHSGFWWTSTERLIDINTSWYAAQRNYAWGRKLSSLSNDISKVYYYDKSNGFSVRCIKNKK